MNYLWLTTMTRRSVTSQICENVMILYMSFHPLYPTLTNNRPCFLFSYFASKDILIICLNSTCVMVFNHSCHLIRSSNFVLHFWSCVTLSCLKFHLYSGLLLREIKDFWRVALLLSTLLYPTDVDYTEGFLKQHFQLDERKGLFKAVENAITELGMGSTFHYSVKMLNFHPS